MQAAPIRQIAQRRTSLARLQEQIAAGVIHDFGDGDLGVWISGPTSRSHVTGAAHVGGAAGESVSKISIALANLHAGSVVTAVVTNPAGRPACSPRTGTAQECWAACPRSGSNNTVTATITP